MTGGTLAVAVARLLGFANPPQANDTRKRWTLGLLKGKEAAARSRFQSRPG